MYSGYSNNATCYVCIKDIRALWSLFGRCFFDRVEFEEKLSRVLFTCASNTCILLYNSEKGFINDRGRED